MKVSRSLFLRLSIFGSWVVTLLTSLGVFILKLSEGMGLDSVLPNLEAVAQVLIPQIGTMTVFFFTTSKEGQKAILSRSPPLAYVAASLTLFYNLFFCLLLVAAVGFGYWVETIDEEVKLVLRFTSFLSVLVVPSVAYLFGASTLAASSAEIKRTKSKRKQRNADG